MKSKYFNAYVRDATGETKDLLIELAYQQIPKSVRQVIEHKYKELLTEQETYSLNPSDPMAFENWVDKIMFEIETNKALMTESVAPGSFIDVVRNFIKNPTAEVRGSSYTETAAYNDAIERDKIYVRNKLAEHLNVSPSEITEYMVEQVVLCGARVCGFKHITEAPDDMQPDLTPRAYFESILHGAGAGAGAEVLD